MAFHDFLTKIRPLVNASGLELAANLPTNTLGKHYRHADGKPNGQPCHPKHFPAIVRALCSIFGCIEINGWRITCDQDGPAILVASRPIPGRKAECIETKNGFEYLQPEWRQAYDDLVFAFINSFD